MTRGPVLRALSLVALLGAGAIVVAVADGHEALFAIGLFAMCLAGVLLMALLFYEVGRSEDRDRGRSWR
ncbi:MAG TPA: hypothetical protein VHB30_01615 [Solirubrobacteraceae bacterium]|nr:hypothetical protein [Solirubrobacteraceae bacterium]